MCGWTRAIRNVIDVGPEGIIHHIVPLIQDMLLSDKRGHEGRIHAIHYFVISYTVAK